MRQNIIKGLNQKGHSLSVIALLIVAIGVIGVTASNISHAATKQPSISNGVTTMINGIQSPTTATASRYSTNDNLNESMDSLKIFANPKGGYLGVYQDINPTNGVGTVRLA